MNKYYLVDVSMEQSPIILGDFQYVGTSYRLSLRRIKHDFDSMIAKAVQYECKMHHIKQLPHDLNYLCGIIRVLSKEETRCLRQAKPDLSKML